MISFKNILDYNPSEHKFNIPNINTQLINLFTFSTTQTRSLTESEYIQHTLSAYSKILQIEVWAQWARSKIDSFDESTILVCQGLWIL